MAKQRPVKWKNPVDLSPRYKEFSQNIEQKAFKSINFLNITNSKQSYIKLTSLSLKNSNKSINSSILKTKYKINNGQSSAENYISMQNKENVRFPNSKYFKYSGIYGLYVTSLSQILINKLANKHD